ncbi:MAG: translation initiation factor IF-3 [Candidatus Paceibacterota bacterium]
MYKNQTRINQQIRASEVRVIGAEGENLGLLSLNEALKKAQEVGLDLIEISPDARPPVAKIMDYGKFQYEQAKKQKQAKSKAHVVETKSIQVKPGTSEHDLELKAKQASDWLKEGNRVTINLFLAGRSKYMDIRFLTERLERILKLVSVEHKIAQPPQKSPKGMSVVIEKK